MTLKRIAFILSLVLISTTLIGCSNTELKVMEAMMKTNEMVSCEKDIELSAFLDYDGFSEADAAELESVKEIINQAKLSLNYKAVKNEENTMNKVAVEGNVELQGMPIDFGLWLDMDMTDEEDPKFVQIIRQPAMMMQDSTKPYMAMDLSDSLTGINTQEYGNIMKQSVELNEFVLTFIREYVKDFDLGATLISENGTQEVDGETLPKYQLKIDDKTAKKLVRHLLDDMLVNGKGIDFIDQLMAMQQKNMEAMYDNDDLSLEETEFPKPTQEEIDEFKEIFNEMMDKLENVTLLGSDGIQVDYVINNDGYIVYESGVVDIKINIEDMFTAFEYDIVNEGLDLGVIQLKLKYTVNTKNINKDITIDIPKLSHENASSLNSGMNAYPYYDFLPEDVIDDSKDITIYVNDQKVEFDNKPLLVNGRTLAPVREVIESIGGNVIWIADSQTIMMSVNDSVVELKIDEQMTFIDGELDTLEEPAKLIDGRTYIPVRYIGETIGGEVTWDNDTSTIHINY